MSGSKKGIGTLAVRIKALAVLHVWSVAQFPSQPLLLGWRSGRQQGTEITRGSGECYWAGAARRQGHRGTGQGLELLPVLCLRGVFSHGAGNVENRGQT